MPFVKEMELVMSNLVAPCLNDVEGTMDTFAFEDMHTIAIQTSEDVVERHDVTTAHEVTTSEVISHANFGK